MNSLTKTPIHHPLSPLFDPNSIALFGASNRVGSVGGILLANLRRSSFGGALVPVNPKYRSINGLACYPHLEAYGRSVDLALIATPASAVPDIVKDCAKAGVQAAIVLTAGFGETGPEGRSRQEAMVANARAAGLRLLGPNCVGLLRPPHAMNATFLPGMPPAGKLALVSQSGAICAAIADGAAPNHLGFSAMVSLGNAADLDVGEIVDFLEQDQTTAAILLYLEGIRNAPEFISALRRAARTKPVVVLKAGHGDMGARAAATHTGALLGSDAVFNAALERTGAVRVTSFAQLFAAAELLCRWQSVSGQRLAIVTNGGGVGVLAADRAADLGLELPLPSAATVQRLRDVMPPFWAAGNPLDILGDARPDRYTAALEACLADAGFDGVLAMLTPQAMTDPVGAASALIAAAQKTRDKPVLSCWMGETTVGAARAAISAAGFPDYETPEAAIEAFSCLGRHAINRRLALELPGPNAGVEPDRQAAQDILSAAVKDGRETLTGVEARALLAAFGIPVTQIVLAATAEAAVAAANRIGYPVAIKIASPDISHKSDVGGVVLDLADEASVRTATEAVIARVRAARPDAGIDGVTVERMVRREHTRELLLGVSRDPVFGPTLMFGAGGVAVEVLRDTAVALPPLTTVLAERLIAHTRVSQMLGAFRGTPPVDRAAVVTALLGLSELVCDCPAIEELDINPLLAGPEGVIALDVRIRIASRPPSTDPSAHLC